MQSLTSVFGLDFMQRALVAGVLVGALCGYLGVYVVLKRIVFVGVALAQISSAGVALALWTAGLLHFEMDEHSPLTMAGAVVLMLAGVLLFSLRPPKRRVPQESTIGVGYAFATAAGLLLIAKSARGEAHMMDLLFGDILTVTPTELIEFGVVAAAVLLVHLFLAKEFLFTSFDPEMASTVGYRPRRWDILFYLTLGLTIAFSIRVAGVLLVFSSLVMPAVAALLVTRRLQGAFALSVVLGALPVGLGLYLSFIGEMPSAACIVGVSFLILLAAGGAGLVRKAV